MRPSTIAHRVTIVIASIASGGAERVVIDLCRSLRDSGKDVSLLTLAGEDTDAYDVPTSVRRVRIEARRAAPTLFHTIWYTLQSLAVMRKRILELDPDVVISHIDQTNVRTVSSLLGTGIPVIIAEHVHPAYNPITGTWRIARQVIYPMADAVTVQSEDGKAWLKSRMRLKRLVVMPNAVRISDDSFFDVGAIDEPRSPFILAIGRLIRQKGFDLLLDAFSRSRLQESGWRLVILGDGTERDALLRQAGRLGVQGSISLPGHVANLGQWLERADMFVMSSRYEGFPNALLEAMQMGRACVSFDCPSGPSMIIDHEQSGLLVPAQDIEEMSAALRRLAFDQDLRGRFGKEAWKVNQRFSPTVVYGKWIELIDAVVNSNSPTPS